MRDAQTTALSYADRMPNDAFRRLAEWQQTTTADPIADLREFGAALYLNRPLTAFERIIVRTGLATGSEFER